jgi:nucleoside-diphosphate-sugar epimerase
MKVFVAGASGVIGRRLVPRLVAGGHEVVAMTRSAPKAASLAALGAQAVIIDALDRGAVAQALMRAAPDVVIHQLSGLAGVKRFKKFDREFALTNRLRTEGTDHLLDGARAAGSRRFIAQSYGSWIYDRTGTGLKTEDDPLDPNPPANQVESMAAIRHLEAAVVGAPGIDGLALRYGSFYGPGTSIADNGDIVASVRKRQLPIVGDGAGVWSFIHVEDAATATIRAIDRGAPGIYNIVDDEPAPVSRWLPELAKVVGAKPPRRVPAWVGRIAAGEVGVSMMTQIRGTSNAKAKRELEWRPLYPSYRDGFRAGLGDVAIPTATRFADAVDGRRRAP